MAYYPNSWYMMVTLSLNGAIYIKWCDQESVCSQFLGAANRTNGSTSWQLSPLSEMNTFSIHNRARGSDFALSVASGDGLAQVTLNTLPLNDATQQWSITPFIPTGSMGFPGWIRNVAYGNVYTLTANEGQVYLDYVSRIVGSAQVWIPTNISDNDASTLQPTHMNPLPGNDNNIHHGSDYKVSKCTIAGNVIGLIVRLFLSAVACLMVRRRYRSGVVRPPEADSNFWNNCRRIARGFEAVLEKLGRPLTRVSRRFSSAWYGLELPVDGSAAGARGYRSRCELSTGVVRHEIEDTRVTRHELDEEQGIRPELEEQHSIRPELHNTHIFLHNMDGQ